MLYKIIKILPDSIKKLLKKTGFARIFISLLNKYSAELVFQAQWADEFQNNKAKVEEYYKKYRFLGEIIEKCNIDYRKKILDVGCGISSVLHFIDGEKFGIDPLADEYKKFYEYPEDIKIIKASGENIPFSSEYFDVIFSTNVLDHVSDAEKSISEIYRVLKRRGYFILTIEIFKSNARRDSAHPHSFTKDDVYKLINDKFNIIWEKKSPWIGLRAYVNNSNKIRNKELILVLEKK